MKAPNLLISFILIGFTLVGFKSDSTIAPIAANDIIGTYWTAEKDAKVRIFLATNGKYSGKTVWMKEPKNPDGSPKTDINNPNVELRTRERIGMVTLKYFSYNSESNKWEGGTVYDPRNGKTYSGYMRFEGNNTDVLYLRGYISGMPFLGRTSEWQRVKE